MDTDIILKKIREIEKTTSQSSVTRKSEKAQKEFINSLENLSKEIQVVSIDGLCLSISKALSDFFTTFDIFLKDVNTKHDIDYKDYMDSLPKSDDD